MPIAVSFEAVDLEIEGAQVQALYYYPIGEFAAWTWTLSTGWKKIHDPLILMAVQHEAEKFRRKGLTK